MSGGFDNQIDTRHDVLEFLEASCKSMEKKADESSNMFTWLQV